MQQLTIKRKQEVITYTDLPLAIYREIAAHLGQIQGIEITLISQNSQEFRYQQSQIAGLILNYDSSLDPQEKTIIKEILDYYGQKYGNYSQTTTD